MSSSRLPTERTPASTAAPVPADASPGLGGTIRDRYTISKRLGSGAFGSVWMARDERLQRDVAVKILARELVSDGRFEREARAAARLSHPGIVTLYEALVDDDGAYLVSELVDGATLDRLLADGSVSDRDILRIGLALCDALDHAHGQGVVHRDVKPSNVLVPAKRADDRPPARGQAAKLTDFGVARVIDSDSLTLTGDVIGTLNYMSPEQAAGLEASEPADLYSLAVVLYEALTGINPLRSNGPATGGRRARPAMLPPLRRQRRDLPASLGDALDRALRPQAGDRGTISDLRFGLERSLPQVGDEPGVVTDWTLRRASADGDTEPLFWPRFPGTAVQDRAQRADATAGRAEGAHPAPSRVGWARRGAVAVADPDRLLWQRRALGRRLRGGRRGVGRRPCSHPGAAAAAAARPGGGGRDAAVAPARVVGDGRVCLCDDGDPGPRRARSRAGDRRGRADRGDARDADRVAAGGDRAGAGAGWTGRSGRGLAGAGGTRADPVAACGPGRLGLALAARRRLGRGPARAPAARPLRAQAARTGS